MFNDMQQFSAGNDDLDTMFGNDGGATLFKLNRLFNERAAEIPLNGTSEQNLFLASLAAHIALHKKPPFGISSLDAATTLAHYIATFQPEDLTEEENEILAGCMGNTLLFATAMTATAEDGDMIPQYLFYLACHMRSQRLNNATVYDLMEEITEKMARDRDEDCGRVLLIIVTLFRPEAINHPGFAGILDPELISESLPFVRMTIRSVMRQAIARGDA